MHKMLTPQNEDTWEAEYWDDYLKEFGVEAYVRVRYMGRTDYEDSVD